MVRLTPGVMALLSPVTAWGADGAPPREPSIPIAARIAPLPRVRGLAAQLAATRAVVASWQPVHYGAGGGLPPGPRAGSPRGGGGAPPAGNPAADERAGGLAGAGSGGGGHANGSGCSSVRSAVGSAGVAASAHGGVSAGTPLTAAMAADMPEYALLGRCPRARAWLAELWDPRAVPPPYSPPLHPAALAGAVAVERVMRYPAGLPTGGGGAGGRSAGAAPNDEGGEDPAWYLPPDEADGSGLGPALVVMTEMAVPVEAPPLRRGWTAAPGGGAAPGWTGSEADRAAAAAEALSATAGAYDEDAEVVTLLMVMDIHRDLLNEVTGGLVCLRPTARGVYHRRTGEMVSLISTAAPPGMGVSRLLMMEYYAPVKGGSDTHTITTLGVGAGALLLLNRMGAVVEPSEPRAALTFPPTDGVTAVAALTAALSGNYGLAYAPALPPGVVARAPADGEGGGGGLPQLIPLVLHCTMASAVTTFRMRSLALAAVRPPPPPPLRRLCAGNRERALAAPTAAHTHPRERGARRPRRARLDLATISDAATRARIVRNRAAAARCNAARREARLAAHGLPTRGGVGGEEGGGGSSDAPCGRGGSAVAPPARALPTPGEQGVLVDGRPVGGPAGCAVRVCFPGGSPGGAVSPL